MKMYQFVQNLILYILYIVVIGSEYKLMSQISPLSVAGSEYKLMSHNASTLECSWQRIQSSGPKHSVVVGSERKLMNQRLVFFLLKKGIQLKLTMNDKEWSIAILVRPEGIGEKRNLQILKLKTNSLSNGSCFRHFKQRKMMGTNNWRQCKARKKIKNRYSESVRCAQSLMLLRIIISDLEGAQNLITKRCVAHTNWSPPDLMQTELEQSCNAKTGLYKTKTSEKPEKLRIQMLIREKLVSFCPYTVENKTCINIKYFIIKLN